ncbi:hypothetical protein [Dongia sp.]|uniref:hypothetical protein n=1 Tax=Dongia sp. TaxID=1977262 RepID=UPI0035B4CEDD
MRDAFGLAHRIGIASSDFWRMTPWQLSVAAEAQGSVISDRMQIHLFASWHAGAFARAKKLPPLDKLLKDFVRNEKPVDPQNAEEQGDELLLAAFMQSATQTTNPPKVKFRRPKK